MDILIVDDEKIIRDATSLLIENAGHYAETASTSAVALESLKESSYDLVLLDIQLGDENGMDVLERILERHPNQPVVMFTAASSIQTAVEAMRRGALDYLEKPFNAQQFNIVLSRVQKHKRLAERVNELETRISTQTPDPTFESTTPAVTSVMNVLFRAAPTPASILLLGESGTGKSVAARAVCERSHLRDKPFVTVSCPSLSRELLESELFGHVKGAFTGAVKDHWGKVKAAEGGTLFLDEIGELPLEVQPKLLRLLQEREYERLGENVTRRAEVRVIAATNRDLPALIREGKFREDLYYRLNVISVIMPALRDRPQDIEQHARAYASHFAAQCGRRIDGFSKCGRAALLNYPWPGNLRELRNAIERAVILCADTQITAEDLPYATGGPLSDPSACPDQPALIPGAHVTLEALEIDHIQRIVSSSSSLQEAAEILGIDQATLYRKRKKFGMKD